MDGERKERRGPRRSYQRVIECIPRRSHYNYIHAYQKEVEDIEERKLRIQKRLDLESRLREEGKEKSLTDYCYEFLQHELDKMNDRLEVIYDNMAKIMFGDLQEIMKNF